jgi:hypothetical protein
MIAVLSLPALVKHCPDTIQTSFFCLAFCLSNLTLLFYWFERRVLGQKPADAFLNEKGQIRLGKRQARRQANPQNRQKSLDSVRQFY